MTTQEKINRIKVLDNYKSRLNKLKKMVSKTYFNVYHESTIIEEVGFNGDDRIMEYFNTDVCQWIENEIIATEHQINSMLK